MPCSGCAKRRAALVRVAGKIRDAMMPVKAPVKPTTPPPPKKDG